MPNSPLDRFRLVVESAPNGIIVVDRKGRITLINRQIETLFGYNRAELIGASVEVLIPNRFRTHHSRLRSAFSNQPETRPMGAGRDLYGRRKNGTEFPVEIGLNAIDNTGREDDDLILAIVVDITARKMSEEHLRLVMRELSHRTKNILAVVQAMAWQTAQTSTDLADYQERFTNRVDALARSHNLLVSREWKGAAVEELVNAQLAPFVDERHERIVVDGPDLLLKPEAAQNLGLALHELATNASKYGALSSPGGKIEIGWAVTDDATQQFQIWWRETGGPEVEPPQRTGFGHSVIKQMVAKAFGGDVMLKFARDGLVWQLTAPATRLFGETAASVAAKQLDEEASMSPDLLRGQRILVVEDDAILAMTVDDVLRQAGADTVGPAATLDSAKQLVAADNLSAAILDIRLDTDEVWPVAHLLAKDGVPFIFLTGHFDRSTLPAEWAQRPILSKPAPPRQIVVALANLVAAH